MGMATRGPVPVGRGKGTRTPTEPTGAILLRRISDPQAEAARAPEAKAKRGSLWVMELDRISSLMAHGAT